MTNKLNLMLHCGANAADLEQVKEVATPSPEGRWHPISHWYLIDQLMKRLEQFGMQVVESAHGLFHNKKSGAFGDRYFGMFQVEPIIKDVDCGLGWEREAEADFSLVFGLRNSHDKKFAAGLSCGSGVFVCDNLAFSGEVVLARKHTKNIMLSLPNIVNTAVANLMDLRNSQAKRIEAYKQTEITDNQAKAIAVDMARMGAINKTNILDVVNEWEQPRHPEFAEKTVWSLFNDTTEVLKSGSLMQLPDRTTKLHALCDSVSGITLDAKKAIIRELEGEEDLVLAG